MRHGDPVTDTLLAAAIRADILATHIEPALEGGQAAEAQQAYIQGNLLRWRGRRPAARGAYLRAAASGHPVYATAARHMLDRILFSR